MQLDLTALRNALSSLELGLVRYRPAQKDEELRDACIQRFEYCFELSWKMVKRRLELDISNSAEVDGYSRRTLFRVAAERGLVTNPQAWFVYLVQRNKTSHTYDAKVASEVAAVIEDFSRDARALLEQLEQAGSK